MKPCKDCVTEGITTERKAPFPGPRCSTHYREKKNADKARAHARHIWNVYQITEIEYNAIKEAQGGKCYICRVANGTARALAVDHDHRIEKTHGVRASIRAILCRSCNSLLADARNDPDRLRRAIEVLEKRPAQEVLNRNAVHERG